MLFKHVVWPSQTIRVQQCWQCTQEAFDFSNLQVPSDQEATQWTKTRKRIATSAGPFTLMIIDEPIYFFVIYGTVDGRPWMTWSSAIVWHLLTCNDFLFTTTVGRCRQINAKLMNTILKTVADRPPFPSPCPLGPMLFVLLRFIKAGSCHSTTCSTRLINCAPNLLNSATAHPTCNRFRRTVRTIRQLVKLCFGLFCH